MKSSQEKSNQSFETHRVCAAVSIRTNDSIWTRIFRRRISKGFLFFFHSFFVVSTPGSRYYADVTGIRIPILSSVSLTSESSASVRSSKGKLQLGDVNPIERTQTNRTRIVIGGVIFGLCGVRHHRDDKRRTLSSSPLFVEEDRPVFVSLYRRIEFGTGQSIESWKTDFSKPFLFLA